MDGSGHFLHSKGGVTPVNTLAMITYAIGIFLIIRELRATYIQVTQPWYADDASAGGKLEDLQEHMWDIMV